MSVQTGTASFPSGAGKSAAAARSKWLKKKSGTPLSKTTTWMSGSTPSSATISASRRTVSPTMRLTGGFKNVIFAICGDVRSRLTVLCSVMMCSIRGAGCWPGSRAVSAGEEVKRDGYELLVVLEDPAVAGVGVDDELAARDPAVQVLGEHGGHHPVVVAVRDQCGL